MRYVNQFKVRQACQLLDNSTDSIRHIALSLGFDDPYYFSRLFKKTMGMSPQHYRASQQSLLANR
jgi:YesN/AraC family two-component response regulator